jgi:hypothetical protein
MNGWKRCADEMPPRLQEVLGYRAEWPLKRLLVYLCIDGTTWREFRESGTARFRAGVTPPTHWTELPEPPEEAA